VRRKESNASESSVQEIEQSAIKQNQTRIACCALVMACSFAPSSMAATTYDITFSTAYGPAPTSGSFTYDSTSHTFSNFDVVFGGATYDLTSAANTPSINHPSLAPVLAFREDWWHS